MTHIIKVSIPKIIPQRREELKLMFEGFVDIIAQTLNDYVTYNKYYVLLKIFNFPTPNIKVGKLVKKLANHLKAVL